MTDPVICKTDPALEVTDAAVAALLEWFKPTSVCPATVGTSETVRLFSGDGAPLAAVDMHVGDGCNEPFLWARMMRRYRSSTFPAPTINTSPCGLTRVAAVELGVAWCAVTDQEPTWAQWAKEAVIGQDVSWRLEEAVCYAARLLSKDGSERQIGTDTITPYGPEGGVIAWTAVIYASY